MEREGAKYTNSNSNISWEKLPSMNFLQCFDSTSEGGRRSRPNHRLAIIRHSLNVPVTYNEYTFYLTFIRNHHRAATGARYNLLSEQSKADIAIRVNHHTATGNHMPSHSLTATRQRWLPAFTPAEAGTQSTNPGGMQGWVDLGGG